MMRKISIKGTEIRGSDSCNILFDKTFLKGGGTFEWHRG